MLDVSIRGGSNSRHEWHKIEVGADAVDPWCGVREAYARLKSLVAVLCIWPRLKLYVTWFI
jgi:hypothetical protein